MQRVQDPKHNENRVHATAQTRRPRIPSFLSTMSNNKVARGAARPCVAALTACDADRAYTQPHAACQTLYDN